jgi:hypothetical protein
MLQHGMNSRSQHIKKSSESTQGSSRWVLISLSGLLPLPAVSAAAEPSFSREIAEALSQPVGEPAENFSAILRYATPPRFGQRQALEPFPPNRGVLSPAEFPELIPI